MEIDMQKTILQAFTAVNSIKGFISPQQLAVIRAYCHGEEGQFFIDKLCEFSERIETMPKTYEQDGKGRQAIAYLHYFMGSADWYITERDADEDGEGQIQVFGEADLGYGPEMGYISIAELIEIGAELDLHFEPTTLSQIDAKRAMEDVNSVFHPMHY
jgi:hypothetical protein